MSALSFGFFSCSVNHNPAVLLYNFEREKSKHFKNNEDVVAIVATTQYLNYLDSSYRLPVKAKVFTSFAGLYEGHIVGDNGKKINIIRSSNGKSTSVYRSDIIKITDIVDLKSEVVSTDEGKEIDNKKGPDVFFDESNLSREFEVISNYTWRFIAFFPFTTVDRKIIKKSVFVHWKNSLEMGGDAVIIDPSLLHSRVIKYK